MWSPRKLLGSLNCQTSLLWLPTSYCNDSTSTFLVKNDTYSKYSIEDEKNERSSSNEELYKNKKTLFDSLSGSWTQNSTAKTFKFLKYQSKLKVIDVTQKPKNLEEVIKLLKVEKMISSKD